MRTREMRDLQALDKKGALWWCKGPQIYCAGCVSSLLLRMSTGSSSQPCLEEACPPISRTLPREGGHSLSALVLCLTPSLVLETTYCANCCNVCSCRSQPSASVLMAEGRLFHTAQISPAGSFQSQLWDCAAPLGALMRALGTCVHFEEWCCLGWTLLGSEPGA